MGNKYLFLGLVIILMSGALFFVNSSNKKTPVSNKTSSSFQEVNFQAPDGYKLSATYYPPKEGIRPATILVHQFNSNRSDFDDFIPNLLQENYAVLSYDIRGMGQSQNGPAQINDFPKDVLGAINFLKTKPEVDKERTAILGASVGANVAFVASGSIPEIKASISLSPSNTGKRGVLLGNEINNFSPHNIFIASDETEKADADFIFSKSKDIKRQKVYPGAGHGRSILQNREARLDILIFLKEVLK